MAEAATSMITTPVHRLREYPAEGGEPQGQHQLQERGSHQQARKQTRPAGVEGQARRPSGTER